MDRNQLDVLFRDRGWYYDNGWRHDDQVWDCYTDSNYDRTLTYFVVLASQGSGRLLEFAAGSTAQPLLWSGPLETEGDVDSLMLVIQSQSCSS
jgi:hypothetical protein